MRNFENIVGPMDGRRVGIGGWGDGIVTTAIGFTILMGFVFARQIMEILIGTPWAFFVMGLFLGYVARWVHEHV